MGNMKEEGRIVSRAMLKYGGSFVKCLGEALTHADNLNTQTIRFAFPEYWKEYLERGHKMPQGDEP